MIMCIVAMFRYKVLAATIKLRLIENSQSYSSNKIGSVYIIRWRKLQPIDMHSWLIYPKQ